MSEMTEFLDRVAKKDAALEQGGAEWLFARVGHVTCSRLKDVMDKLKSGKPGEKRQTYLMELVVERLTGKPTDHFASAAMQYGTDMEPLSRMAYEAATGTLVEESGFIHHPTIPFCGGSCDGLIGDDGIFESKSPWNSANHIYTVLDGMPPEHMAQVQGLMAVTGRKWCDFQSFDQRLPSPLDRYCQRIERDDKYIAAMEAEVIAFSAEVAATVQRLHDKTK